MRLANRIGVEAGEVVAGDAASGDSFVQGDIVNVAARLEQAAGAGEILGSTARQGSMRPRGVSCLPSRRVPEP
jgi:class 3 adenylate cyclase